MCFFCSTIHVYAVKRYLGIIGKLIVSPGPTTLAEWYEGLIAVRGPRLARKRATVPLDYYTAASSRPISSGDIINVNLIFIKLLLRPAEVSSRSSIARMVPRDNYIRRERKTNPEGVRQIAQYRKGGKVEMVGDRESE